MVENDRTFVPLEVQKKMSLCSSRGTKVDVAGFTNYEAIHILKQLAGAYCATNCDALHTATRMLSSPVG